MGARECGIIMKRAIGIFDSGVGGLTVFHAIRRSLPNENLIYLGDTARVPYGTKSAETVIRYSLENAKFLVSRGIKALVVACNTSSAYSLPLLRKEIDVPVIGVSEPGCMAALDVTKSRHIGVIATPATIASNAYARGLKELDQKVRVVSQACPLFVPLVEEGWFDDKITLEVAKRYLKSFASEHIDTLILGCTHYPMLKKVIQQAVGKKVRLIDSAEATAAALRFELSANKMLKAKRSSRIEHQLYVTDLPARFEKVAASFLGGDVPPVKRVDL